MKSRSRRIWPRFVIKKCKFFAIYEILNPFHVYYVVEIKEPFRILVEKVAYFTCYGFANPIIINNPNLVLFCALNIVNLKLVNNTYKTFYIISDYITKRAIRYINLGKFEYSCHVTIGCQTAEYANSAPEIFCRKKIAHLPSFSQFQSAPKDLIFIVFNTYFVTFDP